MSAEARRDRIAAASPSRGGRLWLRTRARLAWRFLTARFSSSLTRRIVVLNLGGLVVLMIGFLLLNQFRADIIAARSPEPDHPGQHHLGRDRRLGCDRHRHHHHRSGQAPAACARPIRRAVSERRGRDPVLHQSGARRARAASAGHADAHPRAHLRQRRQAVARIRVRCPRTARSSAPICPILRNAGGLWSG